MSKEKPTSAPEHTPTKPGIDYKRAENFVSRYANNVFLEGSAWDLKFVFGELDQSITPNTVVQHTAVTLSWAQLKIMKYYLDLHLAGHEFNFGRIKVPLGVIVPMDEHPPKEFAGQEEAYKLAYSMNRDFLDENPEAVGRRNSED